MKVRIILRKIVLAGLILLILATFGIAIDSIKSFETISFETRNVEEQDYDYIYQNNKEKVQKINSFFEKKENRDQEDEEIENNIFEY